MSKVFFSTAITLVVVVVASTLLLAHQDFLVSFFSPAKLAYAKVQSFQRLGTPSALALHSQVLKTASNSAQIEWSSPNLSLGHLRYRTSETNFSSNNLQYDTPNFGQASLSTIVTITKLSPQTTYYYEVTSFDQKDLLYGSVTGTFQTQ